MIGKIFIHVKHNTRYIVLSDNVRFKDSVKGWVDAVAYKPLYENKPDFFLREKESFKKEFVELRDDTSND